MVLVSHRCCGLGQTPLWVFLMVISLLGDRSLVPESLAFLIVVDILATPSHA
jgi:hypothetical protein